MRIFLELTFGILAAAVAIWVWRVFRLRRHKGIGLAAFIEYFQARNISPNVSAAVYDHFRHLGVFKSFQPAPADQLGGIYGIAYEDVDDSLMQILAALHLGTPSNSNLMTWPKPLDTLEDVVNWVSWVQSIARNVGSSDS
jgi:hypothetical protein